MFMKQKINHVFQISKSIVLTFIISTTISSVFARDIYVSNKGNNNNPGTKKQPLETIFQAKKMAVEIMESGKVKEVTVWLGDGIYQVTEPLIFEPLKSAVKDAKLVFKAEKDSKPVISGGVAITGWMKNSDGFWEADLPGNLKEISDYRELFISGKRAIRARFPNEGYLNVKKAGTDRRTNFFFEKGDFPIPVNVKNVELVFLHDWSISRIAVKEINTAENQLFAVDSIGAKELDFFNIDNWEPNPRYFLENAPEFLDADFEWIFLQGEKKFLLKLPESENPANLQILIPFSEGLISIVGKEKQPVKNIYFEGITFQYSKWEIPELGYCGVQACHFDPRPSTVGFAVVPAAIYAEWSENISFDNCEFKNLGGSGVWFSTGSRNCSISDSHFSDISGNGVMIGEGQDREVNGGKWWKVAPEQVALANKIENCSVTECGKQFYGAVGIWCGLTAETIIKNNEIFNLPYSGISIGWMWSPEPTPCRQNTIDGNHIHHIMQILSDGGGIYMLGLQPGSKIINNHIHDVEINDGRAESNGMFLDEGITDVVVENNLIYNIAKSPLRFHKATTNLVKSNFLFCTNQNPPIRYNSTKEEDIQKVDNKVFNEGETNYQTELEKAVLMWKKR
jgi:hypothetical protein